MTLKVSDLVDDPNALTPEKLAAMLWNPSNLKPGYATATLRRAEYSRWSGRINEQNEHFSFGLAMPYLGSGMIVFEELERLEVVHCTRNVPLRWRVEKCVQFRQNIEQSEIFVVVNLVPRTLDEFVDTRKVLMPPAEMRDLVRDAALRERDSVGVFRTIHENAPDDTPWTTVKMDRRYATGTAPPVAAAQHGLFNSPYPTYSPIALKPFPGGSGEIIGFTPANAPAINFNVTPEGSLRQALEMFVRWLAEVPRYNPGAYVTGDEAERFLSDFVRLATRVKTVGAHDRRVKRAMMSIGPLIPMAGDVQLAEAAIAEELSGVVLDVCMDGPTAHRSTSPDKSLLMRTAAANVLQERIDVQRSYANRSPEHKARLEIYEAMKAKIEGIDPGGLE